MSTQPEAKYKRALIRAFKKTFTNTDLGMVGWYAAFVAGAGNRSGVPDLRFAAHGHAAWVEAKVCKNRILRPDGVTSLLESSQRVTIRKMVTAGDLVYVLVEVADGWTRIFRASANFNAERPALAMYEMFDGVATDSVWGKVFAR